MSTSNPNVSLKSFCLFFFIFQDGDCSEDVKAASYAHCEGQTSCTVMAPQSTWGEVCGSWFGDWHDYFVVDYDCVEKGRQGRLSGRSSISQICAPE